MIEQLTLFNLEAFNNYDASIEPPSPEEYSSCSAYECAWSAWERKYPHLVGEVRAMSDDVAPPEELKIGDRFKYKTSGGHLYTLVNIRPGKPKPYTFQADADGSKFSCLHWDTVLEPLPPALEQSQLEPTDTADALQPYNCVREQVAQDTADTVREQEVVKFAPEQTTHWVEEYWVKRNEQKYKYYRYCWMEGRKIRRCHIGGGNVRSPIARRKKAAVEAAITFGLSPAEIEKIIKSRE